MSTLSPANWRSNSPESEALTSADVVVFDNARQAVDTLKKTFQTWVVIGEAVVRARDIADRRGGGKTFMRLIEQQGLGRIINKTTASTLLRIMDELPGITAWRKTLTEKQQIDWAAPTTILKRCPVFAKPKPDPANKPPSKAEQTQIELAKALEENHRLKQQQREDGDRFKTSDTARDIASTMIGMFSPSKAGEIAKLMLDLLKARKRQPSGDKAQIAQ
jgi:hypothetical protein